MVWIPVGRVVRPLWTPNPPDSSHLKLPPHTPRHQSLIHIPLLNPLTLSGPSTYVLFANIIKHLEVISINTVVFSFVVIVVAMHFSALIPVALAAIPLVSASGKLGFALGDKNADGTCKFQADYESDFETIGDVAKIVRVYAASDCNTAKEILPAAKSKGFQVILGIWYVTERRSWVTRD